MTWLLTSVVVNCHIGRRVHCPQRAINIAHGTKFRNSHGTWHEPNSAIKALELNGQICRYTSNRTIFLTMTKLFMIYVYQLRMIIINEAVCMLFFFLTFNLYGAFFFKFYHPQIVIALVKIFFTNLRWKSSGSNVCYNINNLGNT